MGCVSSRYEEEEVVKICRERKKQIKLAVERRYLLANAHCKYCHSLYAVSLSIKLFVARHSNPSPPFLITFPSKSSSSCMDSPRGETVITNPMFLQQNPSQPTTEITANNVGSEEPLKVVQDFEPANVECVTSDIDGMYYYMGMGAGQGGYGWDFFNPFCGGVGGNGGGCGGGGNSEGFRVVREEEGIPDLEEEGGVGVEGNEEGQNGHFSFERRESEGQNGQLSFEKRESEGQNGQLSFEKRESEGQNGHFSFEKRESEGQNGDFSLENKERGENEEGEKGIKVIENPSRGRELLDALKDIEDYFVKADDCGKQVSKMLEANKMNMMSNFEEVKENSTKLIQAITWHRSNTTRSSSSCKSLVASGSKNSTTWTEYKNELFDDFGGMASGSHSLTLGRLYAWEKKLYEEVKEGDNIRKLYERKCGQLRNKDTKGDDTISVDKTRATVKDLYSRILVAIRQAESISEKIQKLRDEELQPQIIELLQGLTQSWKAMMELHETQGHIIFEVKTYDCPTYGKFCNNSHRLATLQLEAEIQNWRECFIEYVTAQRLYVEALYGWLSKFIVPEVEFSSRVKSLAPPSYTSNGPPLYMICRDWLTSMENLPDKSVSVAMKSFARDVRALWVQQGAEQEQKRKVDKMAKELEKKMMSCHKLEQDNPVTKLLEYKSPDYEAHHEETDKGNQHGVQQSQVDYMSEKRDTLESFKRKLEFEKEKHQRYMEATHRITLNGFQTGFSLIFDSLVDFSKTSLKIYSELAKNSGGNLEGGSGEPTSQDLK